jgi:hypothetical protein
MGQKYYLTKVETEYEAHYRLSVVSETTVVKGLSIEVGALWDVLPGVLSECFLFDQYYIFTILNMIKIFNPNLSDYDTMSFSD